MGSYMIERALVIALTMLVLLGSITPFVKGSHNAQFTNTSVPSWIAKNPEIIGYKSISHNGKSYLIYTVNARAPLTYLTINKDGRWSSPMLVGGSSPKIGFFKAHIFVVSIMKFKAVVYYLYGEWHRTDFKFAPCSSVDIYNKSSLLVSFSVGKDIYLTHFENGEFTEPKKIITVKYPIRNLRIIGERSITVKEESLKYNIIETYENNGDWRLVEYHKTAKITVEENGNVIIGSKSVAEWTFMVYMDEDNNLYGYGYSGDMKEMISGYTSHGSGKVNIIVLDDGNKNGDTKLYFVNNTGAHDISPMASSWLRKEMDMGDPNTLINFVVWTEKNYPAHHYFLDLWDHGWDYHGAMIDQTNSDILSLSDLEYAAQTILSKTGRGVDIWGYDACLMNAGADNYAIREGADLLVASETTEGNDGWDYEAIISNLTENPYQNPDEFAKSFVMQVDEMHNRTSVVTMAAINMTRWDYNFIPAYNQLAQALMKVAGSHNSEIREAINHTSVADTIYWSHGIDISDFAKNLIKYVNDSNVRLWANRVLENVSYSVISSYDSANENRTFMAETKDPSEAKVSYSLFRDINWGRMLNQIFNNGSDVHDAVPSCYITEPTNDFRIAANSTIVIKGVANSENTLKKVEVKLDKGNWIVADGTYKWKVSLSLKGVKLGTHVIFARAYDGTFYSIPWRVKVNVVKYAPDLTVDKLFVSNDTPHAGQIINITAECYNSGTADASNVEVGIYYDKKDAQHLIAVVSFGNISKGAEIIKNVRWNTTMMGGLRKIIAYADPYNKISELNENNNFRTLDIYISGNVSSPPQNLTAIAGNSYVLLRWKPPKYSGDAYIENYTIFRGYSINSMVKLKTISSRMTQFNDTSTDNGVKYYYAVAAVNNVGMSNISNVVSAFPSGPPSAPRNLIAIRGDGFATLMWYSPQSDNGKPVKEYRIYRNGELIASVNFTVLIFRDENLSVNESYEYYVTAINSNGESPPSNTVKVMWHTPDAPSCLRVARGDGYVQLWWRKPVNDGGTHILGYAIYRNGRNIANISADTHFYNDTNISVANKYWYSVRAFNGVGYGNFSKRLNVSWESPSKPQNLVAKINGHDVLLTWAAPSWNGGTHVQGYIVYRNNVAIAEIGPKILSYTDHVRLLSKYTYTVAAYNGVGTSPASNPAVVSWEAPWINATITSDGPMIKIEIDYIADGGATPKYAVYLNWGTGWVHECTTENRTILINGEKYISLLPFGTDKKVQVKVVPENDAGVGMPVISVVDISDYNITIAWILSAIFIVAILGVIKYRVRKSKKR